MGHTASKQNVPKETFTPNVEVVHKHQESQLGDVKLVRDVKTGQEMYLRKIVTHDPESHNAQLAYYYNRVTNPHPCLVNVVGYTSDEDTGFCSEKYTINLYVDSLHNNMQAELEKHIKSGELFSEVDLQLLAQNLITMLADFQKKDIAHGEISPVNIFVTDEAYKLCDPTFNGQKAANGAIRYLILGLKSLMAPELLKQIPIQDYELRTNKFKADVFSLGATLLSLASLTNSEDLYDYDKGTMDYKLLDARINKVENIYSPTFSSLLKELLIVEEKNRPDFVQLSEKLNISAVLQNYNVSDPVISYAKVPLVKIANSLNYSAGNSANNSANGSPTLVSNQGLIAEAGSPLKA